MFVFQLAQLQPKKPEEAFSNVKILQGQSAQQMAQVLKENYAAMHAAMMGKG